MSSTTSKHSLLTTVDGQGRGPRPKSFEEFAERLNATGQTAVLEDSKGQEIRRLEPRPRPFTRILLWAPRRVGRRARSAGQPAGRSNSTRNAGRSSASGSSSSSDPPDADEEEEVADLTRRALLAVRRAS